MKIDDKQEMMSFVNHFKNVSQVYPCQITINNVNIKAMASLYECYISLVNGFVFEYLEDPITLFESYLKDDNEYEVEFLPFI